MTRQGIDEEDESVPNRCEQCGRTTNAPDLDGWPQDNRCDYCDEVIE